LNEDDPRKRLQGFPLDEHKRATGRQPAINWGPLFVVAFTFVAIYFVWAPIVGWLLP